MSDFDYHALEASTAHSGRLVVAAVGLALATAGALFATRMLAAHHVVRRAPREGDAFFPKEGMDAVLVGPVPPVAPAVFLPSLVRKNTPTCLFSYGPQLLEDQQLPDFASRAVSHEAWLFGAKLREGTLANITGKPVDIVKGRLLCWPREVFSAKMQQADRARGFELSDRKSLVARDVAQVVKRDGQCKATFWYHRAAMRPTAPIVRRGDKQQPEVHACSECGKAFKQELGLKMHLRQQHGLGLPVDEDPWANWNVRDKGEEVKSEHHPRSKHIGNYQFEELAAMSPGLAPFITTTRYDNPSIDFADPHAVGALNKALLAYHYNISAWTLPAGAIVPAVPGRADYVHHVADLLAQGGDVPRGSSVRVLDIGTGASLIYPILGHQEYGWSFVGTDIDKAALASGEKIVADNLQLAPPAIELRHQPDPLKVLDSVVSPYEKFDVSICNPPFHSSAEEAEQGAIRKWKNLNKLENVEEGKPVRNFAGGSHELWCEGGELGFIQRYVEESTKHKGVCFWFTTLVSKEAHLPWLLKSIKAAHVEEYRVMDISHGHRKSRFLAWTFLDKDQQRRWRNSRSKTSDSTATKADDSNDTKKSTSKANAIATRESKTNILTKISESKASEPSFSKAREKSFSKVREKSFSKAGEKSFSKASEKSFSNARDKSFSKASENSFSKSIEKSFSKARKESDSKTRETSAFKRTKTKFPKTIKLIDRESKASEESFSESRRESDSTTETNVPKTMQSNILKTINLIDPKKTTTASDPKTEQ
eukprot:g46026.t1